MTRRGLHHHAELNRALETLVLRLKALDTPTPERGGDEADQRTARQNVEDVVTERARLVARQARLLAALTRIETGDYGTCTTCGLLIAPKRLDADPAAERCIDCQEAKEIRERHAREAGRPLPVEDEDEDEAEGAA